MFSAGLPGCGLVGAAARQSQHTAEAVCILVDVAAEQCCLVARAVPSLAGSGVWDCECCRSCSQLAGFGAWAGEVAAGQCRQVAKSSQGNALDVRYWWCDWVGIANCQGQVALSVGILVRECLCWVAPWDNHAGAHSRRFWRLV